MDVMDWNEIELSEDGTCFLCEGQVLFGKTFLQALSFHSPGLAPVCDESGWYHITINGEALYQQRYERVFGFYNNRASVILNDLAFHVDVNGDQVYSQRYAWTGNYQEGYCTVRDEAGNYFHIDLNGARIYSENYQYTGDFREGYSCVKSSNGWMHIDRNGKPLNGKKFNDLGVFHKGIATAKDEIGWFHIDKAGKELYSKRYKMIEPYYNGCALGENYEGQKLIILEFGEPTVIEF